MQPITIRSDFPGGNIIVEEIRGNIVTLHQDLRDSTQDWFYWCFEIAGAAGRRLEFRFSKSRALGGRGPAVSFDEGKTWQWLGAERVSGNGFVFQVPPDAGLCRFGFGMAYQKSDWDRFYSSLKESGLFDEGQLCLSRNQRAVPVYISRSLGSGPRWRVILTCRHHSCESMGNYVLEGMLEHFAGNGLGGGLEMMVIPFVDLDGVESGDQGKFRGPRDHNRDYDESPLYPETKALMKRIPEWLDGVPFIGLDLHCPHISGRGNEEIYLVGSRVPQVEQEQRKFCGILESINRGPLPFRQEDFLPFGSSWNTAASYAAGTSFTQWMAKLPGVRISSSVEIPYASALGVEVNAGACRAFGRTLAVALERYCLL